ncbi:MAG TPA: hypothetical protein VMX97_13185 [Hyphomicrobiaceae bacterium]|nr:hypothetical protein [Hyphomicrobiaceae bacterium]
MPKIDLPGGYSAVIALRMAEFRELWKSGAIAKLQELGDGGDLGETYPLLARMVRSWDCTAEDGRKLDPAVPEEYDELEPGVFMVLMTAAAQYIGGQETKN